MSAESVGELFVLSAPSGAGKTTLIRRVFDSNPEIAASMTFSVSHTTRPPRTGEVDGEDYHFVSRETFERMMAEDRFLEWALVHGRHYGTSLEGVEQQTARGRDVLLDIDVQGARSIRQRVPEAPSVFILPPSFEILESRLRGRGLDPPEQIARRLRNALGEIRECIDFDYVIVNDDLDRASAALASVFHSRRFHRQRMQGQIDRILSDFPQPEEATAVRADS